ncbi:MAG: class I SAM-dependent methyltransferase [Mycoplasma sp.]
MKRINKIVNIIGKAKNVIDVGCDHAYLAIELLSRKNAEFVVNVDVNKGPLEQCKSNLLKHGLLEKTINILNNGLDGLENNINLNFDYCVVAGLGSNVIIDIISKNKLNINKFILQTNKNELILRTWLLKNNYKINDEYFVFDRGIYYPIFVVSKCKIRRFRNYENRLLGHKKDIRDNSVYLLHLKAQLQHLKGITNKNVVTKIKNNMTIIEKRIKQYES